MDFEKQPSTDKTMKAEQSTEKSREKNPAEPTIEKYPGGAYKVIDPEKPYFEETIVNGIKFFVAWHDTISSKDYEICFPQVESGEAAYEKGVDDQVIRVSRKPEVAKQVFDYAAKLAQTEPDVYEVYKKVKEFASDLSYDIED